ncbi:hypothetical protein BJY52DRAFT_1117081, partial [Lactarius psammicola]
DSPWQDWIESDCLFDAVSGTFKRNRPPGNNNSGITVQPMLQVPPATKNAGGTSSGGRTRALNADVITNVLPATRVVPSWKAYEMEGTSWTGTAEENTQKYIPSIGVEYPSC